MINIQKIDLERAENDKAHEKAMRDRKKKGYQKAATGDKTEGRICEACGKGGARKACPGCKAVYYCDRELGRELPRWCSRPCPP